MNRTYVDVSKFRTPFNYPNLQLTGLGENADPLRATWPPGRSYIDTSRFRAPYLDYQFQDNTLFGLGSSECIEVVVRQSSKGPVKRRVCPGSPLYPRGRASKRAMGAAAPSEPLPSSLQQYLQTGAPMSTLRRDLGSALGQVPRVAWGIGVLVAGYVAYKAWKAA